MLPFLTKLVHKFFVVTSRLCCYICACGLETFQACWKPTSIAMTTGQVTKSAGDSLSVSCIQAMNGGGLTSLL
jgi:hypothetical protein